GPPGLFAVFRFYWTRQGPGQVRPWAEDGRRRISPGERLAPNLVAHVSEPINSSLLAGEVPAMSASIRPLLAVLLAHAVALTAWSAAPPSPRDRVAPQGTVKKG